MMLFERIENAIHLCEEHIKHLDPTDVKDKEIETYIVSGLVILVVSEYEEHLEKLFALRADKCGDDQVSNYIKKTLSQHFRSPDLSKITDTLNKFNSEYKTEFKNQINDTPQHAAWDSILKARHAIVHKKGNLNLTFRELKTNYPLTKEVITQVETVLGVTS